MELFIIRRAPYLSYTLATPRRAALINSSVSATNNLFTSKTQRTQIKFILYKMNHEDVTNGMRKFSLTSSAADEQYLFDFTKNDDVGAWEEQSDTVRDVGMSKAVLVIHQNTNYRRAIFFALLNPQLNGAGFAGIRAIRRYNLTGHTKLQILCRGQGQFNGFKVVLRHKGLNDEPNYSFEQYFQAPKDEFAVRNLPFPEFKAYFRGKRVNNNETLDLSQISSVGIQMYGGVYQPVKQKGPATLEIDWIRAV